MKIIINFLFIGTINTIFFYCMYALFIFIGFHYTLATLFATSIGMLFSFKTFGKFVFDNKSNKLIVKFMFVTIFNYLFNIFIISQLKVFGLNDYIAGLISVMIVAVSSFVLNKYYVFKKVS